MAEVREVVEIRLAQALGVGEEVGELFEPLEERHLVEGELGLRRVEHVEDDHVVLVAAQAAQPAQNVFHVADSVVAYAVRLVRATRVTKSESPDFVKEWVRWGAGPRAAQYLILGAKAHALIQGRSYVSTDDVKAVAHPVLRHRILTNFQAEAEGVTSDTVVDRLLATIPAHDRGGLTAAGVPNVLGS